MVANCTGRRFPEAYEVLGGEGLPKSELLVMKEEELTFDQHALQKLKTPYSPIVLKLPYNFDVAQYIK